jgi:FlaA1/EpsC-like NDP-sugar epimerase
VALLPYLAATLCVAGLLFPAFGMSRSLWRFTSMRDGLRIVVATVIVILGAVAIGFIVNRLDGVPRGLPVIQGLLIVSILVGARILARLPYDRRVPPAAAPHTDAVETVLVVGLNKLAELYLQCLVELDSAHPVKTAGWAGLEDRRRL